MTKDEALKLALEWAEARREIVFAGGGMDAVNKMNSWVTAIKKALAQPEQEPVAWPCLIAEADFSENTVILAMQCTDYKVSAGNHWLSNTPPQRTWVGLTAGEILDALISVDEKTVRLPSMLGQFACAIEAKLKEKNT